MAEEVAYPELKLPKKTIDSLFPGAALELPADGLKLEEKKHYKVGEKYLAYVQGIDKKTRTYILNIMQRT